MRRSILIAVFFLSVIATFCQSNENYKFWHKDSILIWNDFKGTPIHGNEHYASSNCNISYFFDIKNDTIYYKVNTFLDREKSWKKKKNNTETLLKHEQGHFDIAELYGRILRKELYEFSIPERSITDTVKQIYESNIKKYKASQEEYDNITISGQDKFAQKAYLNELNVRLKELNKFQKTYYRRSMN